MALERLQVRLNVILLCAEITFKVFELKYTADMMQSFIVNYIFQHETAIVC